MPCSSNFPPRSGMVASISLWSSCMSHVFFPLFNYRKFCLLKDLGNAFLTNLVVTNLCSYKQLAEECFQANSHTIPVLSMSLQRLAHLSLLGSHYAMPALPIFTMFHIIPSTAFILFSAKTLECQRHIDLNFPHNPIPDQWLIFLLPTISVVNTHACTFFFYA